MAKDIQATQAGSTSQNSGGASAGVAAHHAKMARHAAQIKTVHGRMTGGLATSPGEKVTPASRGKFLAKGKN